MKKLTAKQQEFCRQYLIDLNASQACKRSGFCKKKPHLSDQVGSQLMQQPHIKAAIQIEMDKRAERVEVKADDIFRELLLIAKVDIGEAYDDLGRLKAIKEIPPHVRRAISAVKVFEEFEGFGKDRIKIGETTEVKFWEKTKALEMLGRHLKLFTDKVEHSGKVTLEDIVAGPPSDKEE